MQHSNIMLIPKLRIGYKEKMILPQGYQTKLSVFEYDLHEHFKIIRGRNSQANLYLASIIISLHKYHRTPSISLTLN